MLTRETVDGIDLRGVEAQTIRGKTFEKPGGWSIVSLDVFHQIHCLVKPHSSANFNC